jgi:hypothetical protein
MRRSLHQLAYLITAILALLAVWALLEAAWSAVFAAPDVIISPWGVDGIEPVLAPEALDPQQAMMDTQQRASQSGAVIGTGSMEQLEATVISVRVVDGQAEVVASVVNRTDAPLDLDLETLLTFVDDATMTSYSGGSQPFTLASHETQTITLDVPVGPGTKLTAFFHAPNGERWAVDFTVPN